MSNDVNFKKLNELEVIESSAENAHVLAEVNGVPKRIPASSVGGGSNMVETVLFDSANTELEFMSAPDGTYSIATLGGAFTINPGKTYTVYMNGVKYERTAREVQLVDMSGEPFIWVILGNAGMDEARGGEDTGEPFAVGFDTTDDSVTVIAVSSELPVDIKISITEEKASGGASYFYIKADSYGGLVTDEIYWDDSYTKLVTAQELVDAINNGVVYINNGLYSSTVWHTPFMVENYYVSENEYSVHLSCIEEYGNEGFGVFSVGYRAGGK